jgi:hypothetical protein
MKLMDRFLSFFKSEIKDKTELNTYEERIQALIQAFIGVKIKNLKWEAGSNFYQDKLDEIIGLAKKQDFENIKSKFLTIPKAFDDLAYFSFTDNAEKNCVAIIYDSNELWQDPQILEIIEL